MRILLLLVLSSLAGAQPDTFLRAPDPIHLIPPAANADGTVIAFGAAVTPEGAPREGTDLYLFDRALRRLTSYASGAGVTSVSLATGFAGFAVQPKGPGGGEEVHLIDLASGVERTLATDNGPCIQLLCLHCRTTCIGPVHLTADARKVLYSVSRNQPFHVVNNDGTGLKELPIYSGALAPSPQRVISRGGQLVFSSSAPHGPTFAAAANDVHIGNLDGTEIRQVTHFGRAEFFAQNVTTSTDGSVIAFESNYQQSDLRPGNQIWVVRSDGSGLRQISTGLDTSSNPSISADGSIVVFIQGGQIKRARTSGDTEILNLTRLTTSTPSNVVLSDDGSSVVFILGPFNGTPAAVYRIPSDRLSEMLGFTAIYTPRLVNASGVVGAAGYGAPTPGSLISVYGANLGLEEFQQAGNFPLPQSLNGVSLSVNGRDVPLTAVTPWQINAQLPQSLAPGMADFQVSSAVPFRVEIQRVSPAILPIAYARRYLGPPQAAAFHAGTRDIADAGRPAAAGDVLEVYGMGLGVTNPSPDAGLPSPASPPARAIQMPLVQIGGSDATVVFAGLTPGLAGVYQVNVVVPAGLTPGFHLVTWGGPGGSLSIAVK